MPQIIELGPEDFPIYHDAIIEIERLSFLSPWSINAFRAELEKEFSHLWVLISDKVPAGYICFWVLAGEIQLMNIAIHPEKRGNHFAEFLLEGMITRGIKEGARSLWLEVRPSNLAARGLYKRMGLHETGIRPGYYPETHEDAIIMSLELSQGEVKGNK